MWHRDACAPSYTARPTQLGHKGGRILLVQRQRLTGRRQSELRERCRRVLLVRAIVPVPCILCRLAPLLLVRRQRPVDQYAP